MYTGNQIIDWKKGGFDLSKDCVLVKVTIKQWTGRKKDDELSGEAARKHKANGDVIETYLTAIDKAERKAIQKIGSSARQWLNFNSAVWDESGWRLVATADYERVRTQMENFKIEFQTAVDQLLKRYNTIKKTAEESLGDLFDRVNFPSKKELEERYIFKVAQTTIQNPDDIRLRHLNGDLAKQIEESIKKDQEAKVADATRQLVKRLQDVVNRVAETLKDDKAIFRDSLINNIRDLVDVIPMLNLGNDPYISKVAATIQKELGTFNPEELRKDPEKRKAAVKKADTLLDAIANVKIDV